MNVSTRSKRNDQGHHRVITYFNDQLKHFEKTVSKDSCGQCRVCLVSYRVRFAEREIYKFALFRLGLIQLKHHFHNETINNIVLNSRE